LGDPQAGLAELLQHIAKIYPADQAQAAVRRREAHAAQRASERESLLATIKAQRDQRPMTSLTFMGALARVLPPNTAVVEEAVTTHRNVLERLGVLRDPSGHFAQRGWALGWGLGCAIGVKLAWPERPVVALVGDGAALYGIQALWTAAHHHIDVKIVICNNRSYKLLKLNILQYWKDIDTRAHDFPRSFDLTDPDIDFARLAESLGVRAARVGKKEEVNPAIEAMLGSTGPFLIDLIVPDDMDE
jgi:thiamine pyrophosphate-dependent acetolactate synthase large subunit-like protein